MLDPDTKKELGEFLDSKVNGKLDGLHAKLDHHIIVSDQHLKKIDDYMAKMQPILDGLGAITVGRKAILWVTSLIVAIGSAILIWRKIF